LTFLFFAQLINVKFYVRVATVITDDKFYICLSQHFRPIFVVP